MARKKPTNSARDLPCPTCQAKAGERCRRPSGHALMFGDSHVPRQKAWDAAKAAPTELQKHEARAAEWRKDWLETPRPYRVVFTSRDGKTHEHRHYHPGQKTGDYEGSLFYTLDEARAKVDAEAKTYAQMVGQRRDRSLIAARIMDGAGTYEWYRIKGGKALRLDLDRQPTLYPSRFRLRTEDEQQAA